LPELGKVVLQMEPAEGGVVLEIAAAQQRAMQHMRGLLHRIGEIATRCGVRILKVRLMRELSAANASQPTRTQIALLTPAIFKTMAEVALLLSQPKPADELFFEPRQ
jgi:hypothetical protein